MTKLMQAVTHMELAVSLKVPAKPMPTYWLVLLVMLHSQVYQNYFEKIGDRSPPALLEEMRVFLKRFWSKGFHAGAMDVAAMLWTHYLTGEESFFDLLQKAIRACFGAHEDRYDMQFFTTTVVKMTRCQACSDNSIMHVPNGRSVLDVVVSSAKMPPLCAGHHSLTDLMRVYLEDVEVTCPVCQEVQVRKTKIHQTALSLFLRVDCEETLVVSTQDSWTCKNLVYQVQSLVMRDRRTGKHVVICRTSDDKWKRYEDFATKSVGHGAVVFPAVEDRSDLRIIFMCLEPRDVVAQHHKWFDMKEVVTPAQLVRATAPQPIGLFGRMNQCYLYATVQLIYYCDRLRAFIEHARTRTQDPAIQCMAEIFDRIDRRESIAGTTMVMEGAIRVSCDGLKPEEYGTEGQHAPSFFSALLEKFENTGLDEVRLFTLRYFINQGGLVDERSMMKVLINPKRSITEPMNISQIFQEEMITLFDNFDCESGIVPPMPQVLALEFNNLGYDEVREVATQRHVQLDCDEHLVFDTPTFRVKYEIKGILMNSGNHFVSICKIVGQAGNQLGYRFWDSALKEHAKFDKSYGGDDAFSTFFAPSSQTPGYKSRSVLVDMEEGVVSEILKSPLRSIFSERHLITDVSGSGNNWAVGNIYYGEKHKDDLLESIRKAAELCDCLQCFFLLHSVGGGTGSGIGTFILKLLADEFPGVYKIASSVLPSEEDDVITSPYNTLLALRELTEFADCVIPSDNAAIMRLVTKVSDSGGVSRRPDSKPFDDINDIIASMLLNLTCSARFCGNLNVDLNEITMNLVPFPRLHFLIAAQSPFNSLSHPVQSTRKVDQLFTEVYQKQSQLIMCEPRANTFLATALLVRGNVCVSDVRRNIDRLHEKLPFVPWNRDGWKVGMCQAPPLRAPAAILGLSNNTAMSTTFREIQSRFHQLYKRKAHLHHYLNVDGFEADFFTRSNENLRQLCSDYDSFDAQRANDQSADLLERLPRLRIAD